MKTIKKSLFVIYVFFPLCLIAGKNNKDLIKKAQAMEHKQSKYNPKNTFNSFSTNPTKLDIKTILLLSLIASSLIIDTASNTQATQSSYNSASASNNSTNLADKNSNSTFIYSDSFQKESYTSLYSASAISTYKHIEQADGGHYIAYMEKKSIKKHTKLISKDIYKEVVKQLPITCVDIFVYNPQTQKYFTLIRTAAPAKGMRWIPGGRLLKGESFFEGAIRKCDEDAKLEVEPLHVLNVYSTHFPDSEWEDSTHTVNVVVLAVSDQEEISLHGPHASAQWLNINEKADNIYVEKIRQETINVIKELENYL